jgi:hypothetical protein
MHVVPCDGAKCCEYKRYPLVLKPVNSNCTCKCPCLFKHAFMQAHVNASMHPCKYMTHTSTNWY